MQSKATTVEAYLRELPADRREALQAVREVILKNLDKTYAEGMGYGMIGYSVPHSVYPAGYHCDPKQPLPFAGLASQKNHMSLYLMCLYGELGAESHLKWFEQAWAKTGKKLDMGKSCIRFKRVEDLALDVIGETIRRVPVKLYIDRYESLLGASKAKRVTKADTKPKAPAKAKPGKAKAASTNKKTAVGKATATKKTAKKR